MKYFGHDCCKMAAVKKFWEFMFSPTLYTIYNDGRSQLTYEPNAFEKIGDQMIQALSVMWNVGLYVSPVIATILYRRGYFAVDNLALTTKLIIGIGVVLSSSYCIRGLGRLNNPVYVQFYKVLLAARKSLNKDTKKALCKYDFDFKAWPVDFRWTEGEGNAYFERSIERSSSNNSTYGNILSLPSDILSYIVAHTFGIKMVYPGSIRALQYFTFSITLSGRNKLITEFEAERFKLRTKDGNDIDSIFVDRRKKENATGEILVICCEGNAGYYEFGIAMIPIKANYSVLGWNHPGFGGSTGTPFPSQEQNAIDCVMQFAIHHLGFPVENILLFGWSIGGYTSSWAAMNYQDIKGVILDATFDDILPLAIPRMPKSWEPLVRKTIRTHINLNVYEQIRKFNGPVTFIRRTEDELICTEPGNLSTNRGNHLVAKFLKYRYPKILDEKRDNLLNEWLASESLQQSLIWDRMVVDKLYCNALINSYVSDNPMTYPMLIGETYAEEVKNKMALFLVDAYLKNFKSSHCTSLPLSMFRLPWSPSSNESSFVKL